MSRFTQNPILPVLLGAVALVIAGNASAQSVKALLDKPAFEDLDSPQFNGGKQKAFRPKYWLEIEGKINLEMKPEPLSKTLEKLTVRWYVAIKNPERPSSFLLLTKDVEHVNVPLKEDVYVSIYLSPSSVKRLTGGDRAAKSMVELVGYEVLVNGERVAMESSKGDPGWWNRASPNISRSETVPLLTKPETPFSSMWWDRYAEVHRPESR